MSRPAARTFGPPLPALIVGALALLGWIGALVIAPAAALQGWWTAFVFASGPAFGALALMLIRRLTGGDWGEAFAPELEPAARAVPLVALFALPGLIGSALVFRWAAAPGSVEAQVRHAYLNGVSFGVREVALLVALALIAWRLPKIEGPRGRLGAGLGLVVYGVAVTFFSVDWVLSTQTSYTSSASGMVLATQQLAAALAFAALQGRVRPSRHAAGDLAALLFTTLLGLLYLAFMSYLVVWYGDRPNPDRWYILRTQTPWRFAAHLAMLAGFAAPAVLLALRHITGQRTALVWSGAAALLGLAAFSVWQVGAAFGPGALLPALLAVIAQGGLFVAAAGGLPRLPAELARGKAAHAG